MDFPPFEPGPPERGRARRALRAVPLRNIAPNMITLLALCAGLTAIRMSIEARFELAIIAILFAAFLDGIDGRVARLLKSTSRFGAELDSLADFVNFGVAPAILLYSWTLNDLGSLGWIAALVFAICSALRLARFNAALDGPKNPSWMSNFFVGVPAPAGAFVVLLPVYLHLVGIPWVRDLAPVAMVYMLGVAFLMVSRLPTLSGKKIGERVPREAVLPVLLAVAIAAALLFSFPWSFMAAVSVAYLASIPFGYVTYGRMERRYHHPADEEEAPAEAEVTELERKAAE